MPRAPPKSGRCTAARAGACPHRWVLSRTSTTSWSWRSRRWTACRSACSANRRWIWRPNGYGPRRCCSLPRSGTDSAETPGRHPALSAAQCAGRDVQPVAVQGMVRRLAAAEPAELAERALGHAVQLIALRAGDMGGELDGGHVPQRVVGGEVVVHVEHGADPPADELRAQCVLVDERRACGVD